METTVKVIAFIIVTMIIALLTAFPVMWLWNLLMPKIFGLITLDFTDALGLNVLCSFLFKGSSSSK